jgi:hypothetical protein
LENDKAGKSRENPAEMPGLSPAFASMALKLILLLFAGFFP